MYINRALLIEILRRGISCHLIKASFLAFPIQLKVTQWTLDLFCQSAMTDSSYLINGQSVIMNVQHDNGLTSGPFLKR